MMENEILIVFISVAIGLILYNSLKGRIERFWKELQLRGEHQEFLAGFGWAMSEYYIDGISLGDIENFVSNGEDMSGPNAFDKGARRAINQLIEIGLMEKECTTLKSNVIFNYVLRHDGDVIFNGKRFTYSLFDGGWSEVKSTKDDEQ